MFSIANKRLKQAQQKVNHGKNCKQLKAFFKSSYINFKNEKKFFNAISRICFIKL